MFSGSKMNKVFTYGLVAITMTVATSAFAEYNYRQNSNRSYAYGDDNTDNAGNATLSDSDLAKKVRDKISSGWFSKGFDQVNVDVRDGNVTLQGTVKTWDDKDKVEKEVRNINGVKSLDSKISVQEADSKENMRRQFPQDTYSNSADDQLNKKIRDKVSRGWLWNSYQDVTLNTTNGVVTLQGAVDSMSDQQKLMTEIQKVDGVQSVKSELRIKNR